MARVVAVAATIVIGAVVLHYLIFGFSIVELFVRPRITGGGSGQFGIDFFGYREGFATLWRLPTLIAESLGIVGILFAFVLVVVGYSQPKRLLDPLSLAWLIGLILWNVIVIETEIQRHSSMVGSMLALVGIGLLLPPAQTFKKFIANAGAAAAAVTVLYLHSDFVGRLAYGGSFLPMALPWRDYFCINNVIRSKYPGLPVVVRTPDNHELPIATEATSAMVWSQVAFVHHRVSDADAAAFDRINPRDRQQFKRSMLAEPQRTREELLRLDYKGLIWGPVEESGWGPQVRDDLTKPANFLASCGRVALYALTGAAVPANQDIAKLLAENRAFLSRLADRREQICRPYRPLTEIKESAVPTVPPGLVNVALKKPARVSTRAARADFAVDGVIGTPGHPVPISRTDGSDFKPLLGSRSRASLQDRYHSHFRQKRLL